MTISTRRRLRLPILLATLVALWLGFVLPPRTIDSGVEQYRGDPLAYATAVEAHAMAARLMDHPLTALGVRARRVTRVWRDPGHCQDPRPGGAQGEYRADVQTYLWFGVPGPRVRVQCGGWYGSLR